MNAIRVLDSTTYAELARIENVISPLITEEINGVFNFEFETIFDEISKFASGGNIIAIEDDYFRIATTTKNLDGTYRVFAEHVSFALTRAYFEDYVGEGVDGTASDILTPMLNQIGWGIGSIVETPAKYYKPSQGTSVRRQILDVADLFGLEIIWHKFSVSLVTLRGSLGPIPFKLGENLLGVSETLDLTGEYPEFSYEVDVLDLSQLEGYEDFVKIELGDVVQLLAQNIELDGISRVVYRQYNPFEKVNVNLQIGHVARDFTNYERDEDEEEEADGTASYFLSTFKVGQVDCLKLSGVEMDFESVLPEDVSSDVDYFAEGEHKGVTIALKSQYSNYHATVTKFFEDGSYTDFNLSDTSMQSWNLPEKNLVALTVTVSQVPIEEVDLDVHKTAVYGVTFNKVYIDPLREFKIGQENILKLNTIIDVDGQELYEEDFSTSLNYSIINEYKGMKLSLNKEFKDYKVYITLYDEEFNSTVYDYDSVKEQLSTRNFPTDKAMYLLVTVQEKPNGEFNENIHKRVMYGIKFEYAPIDPLREFKVSKQNILNMNALIDTDGKKIELEDFSATLDYHLMQEYEGVKLSLSKEFKDYTITITTFNSDSIATVYDYATVKDQLATWKLPRKDAEYLLVSISEVPNGQFNPAIHKAAQYGVKFEKVPFEALSELSVGGVECLYLSGVMLSPNPKLNEIQAEVFYSEPEELKGFKMTLKREYRDYYARITVRDNKGKATTHSYDEIMAWNFPSKKVDSIVIEILEKPPGQFDATLHNQAWYGFKFIEQSDEPIDGDYGGVNYYIESETVKATSSGAQFDFTVPYDAVISVTLGVGQTEQEEPVTAYWSLLQDEDEMHMGVSVEVKGLTANEVDVSIQVVCQEGIEEEEEEGEPID